MTKKKQKEMEKEQKKKQKDDKKKKKHRPIEKESYNICILGPVNCGKTAIMKQFIEKIFQEEYQPSIADSYNKQIAVEKKTVALKITEIGGADMKNESTHKAIETNDCFILVYSIISLDSFMDTIDLHEQIVKIKVNPRVPIFIFANKNDLETKREVMDIDVKNFVSRINAPFLETSAKLGTNIDEGFKELILITNDYFIEKKEQSL